MRYGADLQYVSGQSLSLEVTFVMILRSCIRRWTDWMSGREIKSDLWFGAKFSNWTARTAVGIWRALACAHAGSSKLCCFLEETVAVFKPCTTLWWRDVKMETLNGGVQFMMCCLSPVLISRSAYASVSEKEHNTGRKTRPASSFTCPTSPLCDIFYYFSPDAKWQWLVQWGKINPRI